MTANEWNALIGLVGTSILGPLIAYAKSTANARAESEKIQAEKAYNSYEAGYRQPAFEAGCRAFEEHIRSIEEMGVSINEIKTSVARIEAILPLLVDKFKEATQ